MNTLSENRKLTVEQYIKFEELAEERHDFLNGQLTPKPSQSDRQNDICFNLHFVLRQHKIRNYSSVKVEITARERYVYPDLFITCDERDLADHYIKRYPIVVFEVTSNSSKVFDKTGKFIEFQQIESLQHYVIVDSESIFVEIFSRDEFGKWTKSHVLHQLSDVLQLTALGLDLPLTDIYEEQ